MTSKVNQRGKRKNEFSDAKNEPNMKALKKDEIISHFNALQSKYNLLENKILVLEKKNSSLEEEKKTHNEAILLLEETITVLERKAYLNVIDTKTTEIQTDISELEGANTPVYLCEDCDYVADCIHDFNDHTHSPDDLENIDKSLFTCNFCDESFAALPEVMKHNKIMHAKNVPQCEKFMETKCFYGENCWFLHCETFKQSEPSFKCNFCDDKLRTHNGLREHMKLRHIQFVAGCKNELECKYGPKKCWFLHKENIENTYKNAKDKGQNNHIIFDMELNSNI